MAIAMDVTPAGDNLFQVDIVDTDPATTDATTVEVAIGDHWLEDLDLEDDASPQDVVLEAVRFVLDRTDDPDQLARRLTLDDIAQRYPSFHDHLQQRLADPAHRPSTDGQHTAGRGDTDQDARLVAETVQAQDEGRATRPEGRF